MGYCASQRFLISRVLFTAVGIVLLWLASALPSEAAYRQAQAGNAVSGPAHARNAASRQAHVRDAAYRQAHARARQPVARRTVALKKVLGPMRPLGSLGGPLRVRKISATLLTRRLYLRRFAHTRHQDEDNAIQNDAPAAPFCIAPLVAPELRGQFVDAFEQQPFTVTFSPRPPRGPPAAL